MSKHPRARRDFRRKALTHALLVACASLSLPAFADDECGAATPGGQVVCEPAGTDPVPQVRYTGVDDFDLVFRSGFNVDGNGLPEGDTAVVVYGSGAINLTAEDGTVIQAHDSWPAVDVVSSDGPVNVRVDTVLGGNLGIAALAEGDVTVWANYVEGGTAIEAISLAGNVLVDVAAVRSGGYGTGVLALAEQGNVGVLAGEVWSEGDFGYGIDATSYNGSVSVEAGFVSAIGVGARAIHAVSYEGGDVIVDVQVATATGEGSTGIVAAGFGDVYVHAGWIGSSGDYGFGLGVFALEGSAVIDVESVGTDGLNSRGVDVAALGDVTFINHDVFTNGDSAEAVNLETVGDIYAQSTRLTTYGNDSTGLRALTTRDILVDVEEIVTFGERSAGLNLWSSEGDIVARVGQVATLAATGDWYAIGLGAELGNVMLQVDDGVYAESGYAITLGSTFGNTRAYIAEGATVYGATTAIDSAAGGTSRIDIAGHVSSSFGPVISVAANYLGDGAADIRIGSTGTVEGWLRLGENADSVANGGTFLSSGTSDFGTGNDTFTNLGRIGLQGGAGQIHFQGLETLDNRGLVDLANGAAGDLFSIDGTFKGGLGSVIAVDLDVATHDADQIEVGKLEGTTVLKLDLAGSGPLLGMDGIRVLTSDAAQDGDELVLASDSRNIGFIGFRLDYDGLDSWSLTSDLADAAYLAGAVPSAVRDSWRQGVQAVTSHLDATRGDEDSTGAWLQVFGGDFDGTSDFSHAQGSRELAWNGSHQGLQAGLEGDFGHWRAGVTAGIGEADMDLGGPEGNAFDSVNAGVYARYERDGWFAGAVLRADRLSIDADWASIGLVDSGDGNVLGLQFEGGRRFEVSRVWVEPSLRLSWTDLSLPELDGASGDVHWQDGSRATGELGLSIGLTQAWKGLSPYVSMAIAREFGGADRTDYDTAFDDVVVDAEGGRSFGRFAAGLQWRLGRVDLYGEVDARTGDIEGSTARLGARVRF